MKAFAPALLVASMLLPGAALASHKSWVLEHPGNKCSFDTPAAEVPASGAGEYGSLFLWNDYSSRPAECPLVAANRWGSSGTIPFAVHRWAEAKSAFVHVYQGNASQAFTCQPVARLRALAAPGGALYFGTARSVSGIGNHTLELVTGSTFSWGSTLEATEQAAIRSLDIQCVIPTGSAVRGYGAKLCQNLADCHDDPPKDDFSGNNTFIQGNGAECTSRALPTARGADGLTINGDASGDLRANVWCPVLPPGQDSYQHQARYRSVRLYVAGGSPGPGCELNRGCPLCVLKWELRDTGATVSSPTFTWNSAGYLEVPSPGTWRSMTGVASAVGIDCLAYKGQRIRGYTMQMTQTRVSSGQ